MSDDEAVVPPTPKVVEGAADSEKFSFFLSSSHLSPEGWSDAGDPSPEVTLWGWVEKEGVLIEESPVGEEAVWYKVWAFLLETEGASP